ncbi:unnamed protein product [Allacma fusca]|uniref:Uncharacterized protein n=1 Tax=Allacma fusca TaxID=39272 RepID=A0A8J2NWM3_9HEXA|nr:unnamed protein product [Allacma fusca]
MGSKFYGRLLFLASVLLALNFMIGITCSRKITRSYEIKYEIPGASVLIRQQFPFYNRRRKYIPPTENILLAEETTTTKSWVEATTVKDDYKDFYDYWFRPDN